MRRRNKAEINYESCVSSLTLYTSPKKGWNVIWRKAGKGASLQVKHIND